MTTPAKSALDAARERLEESCKYGEGIEASIGWKAFEAPQSHSPISTGVHVSDLRIALAALKEAERIRHKMDPALSAKVGHPTCGKCGVVIPEPETCCRATLGKIDLRTETPQ